jgi:sigma-B regulation protein RsbU (phosphoserine phosphatase)
VRFCTALFGLLGRDGDGFTVALSGGGHPAPLLIRAAGTARFLAMPASQLIGVWPDATFGATSVRLSPGDALLLYTDGITEARTAAGRYGDEALQALAAGLAPTTAATAVSALVDLLTSFGEGVDDDTAVLAVSVPPR